MTTKLLAVDDSKTLRKVLEITFGGDDFQTTIAGSATEALSAVQAEAPQVAVVDAHLGAESGYDLCREIKAASPDTKVILLSSKQRPYDAGAGGAAGADGNFDKPFDSTKMLAKVAEIAESAGAQAPAAAAPAARPAAPAPVAPAPVAAPAPAASPAPVAAAPAAPSRSATGQRPPAPQTRASAAPPRVSAPQPTAAEPAAAQASAAQPSAHQPSAHQPAPVAAASAPAANAVAAATAGLEGKLQDLGLTGEQMQGVLALSREVVEQVVWEVVPTLAETLIKEEIARLTAE